MPERRLARPLRPARRAARHVSERPPDRQDDHLVRPIRLLLRQRAYARLGEQPHTIELSVTGIARVQAREVACAHDAVHRGNLGLMSFGRVDDVVEEAVGGGERARRQRLAAAERLELLAHRFVHDNARFELGDLRLDARRRADEHLGDAERAGDLFGEEAADAASVDAAHELARQPAERQRVIAGFGARFPERRQLGDRGDGAIPIEQIARREAGRHLRNAGLMRQHVVDADVRFAVLGELGPVRCDGIGVVDEAPLGEQMDAGGGQPLRRRERDGHRVALPRALRLVIGEPAPEIDDLAAAVIDSEAGPNVHVLLELLLEYLAHRLEPGVSLSLYHGHLLSLPTSSSFGKLCGTDGGGGRRLASLRE